MKQIIDRILLFLRELFKSPAERRADEIMEFQKTHPPEPDPLQGGQNDDDVENHTPPPEPAAPPAKKTPTTIKEVALSLRWYDARLKQADQLTAAEIERWMLENIEYEFHWNPRGIKLTWAEKRGDCTDRAMLAQKMLEFVGIKSQRRHGYANGEKHDWLKTDKCTLFIRGYDTVELVGGGFW